MGSKQLPARPQWYKDMAAKLRAQRKKKEIPEHEFLELGADEIQGHEEYLRFLARTDLAAYDRAITRLQRQQAEDEDADARAKRHLQPSLLPREMLEKLGLDPDLELGFGRTVGTLDASPEQRLKAIKQLERNLDNSNTGMTKKIASLKQAHEMAGDKTLREIIDDRPDEYGAGGL